MFLFNPGIDANFLILGERIDVEKTHLKESTVKEELDSLNFRREYY